VLADAGRWSDDNVNLAGVESIIAPGKARKLRRIADADHERSAGIADVEAGEIDKPTAADQLGVTRTRVNQLLRRRHPRVAESLTTTMIITLDTPRGKRLYKKPAATIEPVFAQIKHTTAASATSPAEASPRR
jgi:hypothetical protein